MARLTTKARNALPDSAFAGPNRTYPIPDRGHAQAAEGRAAEFAGPKLKQRIDAKVAREYPGMGGHRVGGHQPDHPGRLESLRGRGKTSAERTPAPRLKSSRW
jgi:hypothetical protein